MTIHKEFISFFWFMLGLIKNKCVNLPVSLHILNKSFGFIDFHAKLDYENNKQLLFIVDICFCSILFLYDSDLYIVYVG